MDETNERPLTLARRWWLNTTAAVVALAAVAALAYVVGRNTGPLAGDELADAPPADMLLEQPPVVATSARTARSARVRPETRVIGVRVGGKHRAYVVSAMTPVRRHVLNDMVSGVPVTVAYCDRTDCARAFTAANRTAHLDLAVGGWSQADGMLVRVGNFRYAQESGRAVDPDAPPFAYQPLVVERTTWGTWVATHPDTDLVEAD